MLVVILKRSNDSTITQTTERKGKQNITHKTKTPRIYCHHKFMMYQSNCKLADDE